MVGSMVQGNRADDRSKEESIQGKVDHLSLVVLLRRIILRSCGCVWAWLLAVAGEGVHLRRVFSPGKGTSETH